MTKPKRVNQHVVGLFLLIVFITCFTCGLFYQWVFNGCVLWSCAPWRNFTVFSLDIPMNLFPSDSTNGQMGSPTELNGAIEAAGQTVYWSGGGGRAVYIVERYGGETKAQEFFRRSLGVLEHQLSDDRTINLDNLYAEQYKITCGNTEMGRTRCFMFARYEEYLIIFSSSIDRKMSERALLFQ